MRLLVVVALALPTFAAAEPATAPAGAVPQPEASVGLTQSLVVEKNLAMVTSLELGVRIASLWVEGALGLGGASLFDPAGSGQEGSRVVEARAGVGRLDCGRAGCLGWVGAIGYHRQRIDVSDGLLDPPMYTEKRDLVFGELRAIARARIIGGHAALEAAVDLRYSAVVVHEHSDGDGGIGAVGTLGIHATF